MVVNLDKVLALRQDQFGVAIDLPKVSGPTIIEWIFTIVVLDVLIGRQVLVADDRVVYGQEENCYQQEKAIYVEEQQEWCVPNREEPVHYTIVPRARCLRRVLVKDVEDDPNAPKQKHSGGVDEADEVPVV